MDSFDNNVRSEGHVKDYLAIVWRRKWLCLFVFLALSAAGLFVVAKLVKPWYQAQSRIAIERFNAPVSGKAELTGEAFYQTQYEIMGSSEVAALAAYNLGRSPSPESAIADGQADIIRRAVSISPQRNSRIVRVSSRQRDPEAAAAVVNEIVRAYSELAKKRERELSDARQKEMQDQISILQLKIENKKKVIDEFTKDKKLHEQRQQKILITTKLTALSQAQVVRQVARKQAEENYNRMLEKFNAGEDLVENPPSPAADRILASIRSYQNQMNLMKVGKNPRALENDPEYNRLKELVAQYQRDYDKEIEKAHREANAQALARAKFAYEQAKQVEQTIRMQMAELQKKVDGLVDGLTALSKYEELKKDLANLQVMHDELQKSLLQATISDNFPILDIRVLDVAKAPTEPAWPNKKQLVVVVLALALLLSVGLAFFLDYMDRSVQRPEDVEQELRLPFMGFVPSMHTGSNRSHRREKVIITDPSSGPAESYRKIRARLQVYRKESHAKTFTITSTTAGEGKTTLASNLALAFALSGTSVLLVDADMRHPKVHEVCDVDRTPGLGEYLAGKILWQSIVRPGGTPGLFVIPAGAGGTHSAEFLESPRMGELLKEAAAKFNVILIDSPPVLGVADSTTLCHLSDATIFTIQAAQNSKWLIRRARMELAAADANVIGAVLNRVRSQRGDYYYYHRYYPKKA